jgi:hypothetical protein
MKARLLLPILGVMLLVSACSEQSQVNDPITNPDASGSAAKIAQLNLTIEQAAVIDEMYYMEEDLSILLDPVSFNALNEISDGPGDRRVRGYVDMAAIVYYNLILKAMPDLGDEAKTQIREWIAASNAKRAQIIADGLAAGLTREEIAALLADEHETLMGLINGLIGPNGVAAVEAYKLKLQEERERIRQEMIALRIDREVQIMTEKLGLTEEQAAAVKAALTWQQAEIARIRAEYANNPEGFREALKTLLAAMEAKMIAAMGEENWLKWKEIRSGRTGGEVRDPILEQVKHLTQLLTLNAEQQAAITRILTDQQNQIKALVQKYGSDRRGLAMALRELQMATDKLIQAQLTAEQLRIWLQYRTGGIRPGGGGRG